jgi:hypothetical protein
MARPPHDRWVQGNSAGPYSSPVDKFLIHTTEGGSIDGAIAAYRAINSWPHLTVDARVGRAPTICGHLDLDVAARSLRNMAGGVQTNTDGVIQIEVVGNAANPAGIDWAWIGDHVVGPICQTMGIPVHSSVRWVPYPQSYGLNASQRLSAAAWTSFQGVLGHQHAPENDHGDPGAIPIVTVLDAAKHGGSVPKDWFDMATQADLELVVRKQGPWAGKVDGDPSGAVFVFHAGNRVWVDTPDALALMRGTRWVQSVWTVNGTGALFEPTAEEAKGYYLVNRDELEAHLGHPYEF